MQKAIIALLLGCMGMLLVVILLIGLLGGGLNEQTTALAQAELKNLETTNAQIATASQEIKKALKDSPALFASEQARRPWPARLEEAQKKMELATHEGKQLKALVEKNDSDDTATIQAKIGTIQGLRIAASSDVEQMRAAAEKLLEFKKDLAEKLPQLEQDYRAIQAYDLSNLKREVEKASADWPEKESNLQRRLAVYTDAIAGASRLWALNEEARERAAQGKATGADVAALVTLSGQLEKLHDSLEGAETELPALIEQLYWVWDKVLTDMEIQEGSTVTFRQQFTVHRYPVVSQAEAEQATNAAEAENATPGTAEATSDEAENATETKVKKDDPEWRTVSKQTFESMKKKLGMAVAHKPAGKFDHEATSLVQPPGYAYMCPVNQQRNRYGYWRHRPGGLYYWYFYRPYYPMRNRYFGSSYTPVTSTMYNDYDMHRQSGRTYYGRDNSGRQLYGSSGVTTRQAYSNSRYVTSNGYKNTQYVKSGGTYRGSRYARSQSSSRNNRSSSYSSRSRSRFSFGGK